MDTTCAGGCGKQGEHRCSGCKQAHYCSAECQKNLEGYASKSALVSSSLKDTYRIKDWQTHKKTCLPPLPRPRTTHCTGCQVRFSPNNDMEKQEANLICPDCGYVACSNCACHNRRGTCYCQDSNFGHKYCGRVPEWYHFSQRTGRPYSGSNHPDHEDAKMHKVPESVWETEPRQCGNCEELKVCLTPGFRCQYWMCQ
ncbi:hypothetical protein FB45DRAFT_843282 [Roridomyces roridus]|uniref:MYND-type domain-containing protein n=1 Tax=Roridomyces roridus TaxID=1738132 RepID=A0AAD7FAR7_9AGAR|nr:hypothetical protein FB45DRAFT_843282 [Roridomyces roridus]